MIREKETKRRNIFDTTIRDRPEDWTARVWRAVYQFLSGGSGLANQTNTYVEGKFLYEVDPKDGFPVRDCRDARNRRLLEFIVPIIHPNKSTWVTITIGNTIFGALEGERLIDWGKVFMDLVHTLIGGAGKTKPTSICPFSFHLYESQGLLIEEEETDYRAAQELAHYRITPEPELECISGSDNEGRSVPPSRKYSNWRRSSHLSDSTGPKE